METEHPSHSVYENTGCRVKDCFTFIMTFEPDRSIILSASGFFIGCNYFPA